MIGIEPSLFTAGISELDAHTRATSSITMQVAIASAPSPPYSLRDVRGVETGRGQRLLRLDREALGVHLGGERRDLALGDVAHRRPDRVVLLGQRVEPTASRRVTSASVPRTTLYAVSRRAGEPALLQRGVRGTTDSASVGLEGRRPRRAVVVATRPGCGRRAAPRCGRRRPHGRHRHPGRHLHDRQQAVQPVELVSGRGTPITGSGVAAATIPGRWAAPPAPAMITRRPRSAAASA